MVLHPISQVYASRNKIQEVNNIREKHSCWLSIRGDHYSCAWSYFLCLSPLGLKSKRFSFCYQMYRGRLSDGSLVAIRCLKLKKSHSSQNFNRHIELISKLRYRHLASALGHCFEYYLDDSSVSRLFLIFEYISNGTLRSNISGKWLALPISHGPAPCPYFVNRLHQLKSAIWWLFSEGVGGQVLTWTQRIAAAIGVAKGIQFLHAGIIPGLFGNDLRITNILLDQNLVAKISSYNLPVLAENMKREVSECIHFC